jgi:hypothetical protein
MPDYLAAEKASGGRCAFGVYLSEKRWERLGPKKTEADKPTYAPPLRAGLGRDADARPGDRSQGGAVAA